MAYGKSTGFKLFMGASTATPLPVPGSDTFTEIGELQKFSPPGSEQEIKSYYVLNDGNPRAVGGRLNDRVVEGTIILDWTPGTPHPLLETDASTSGGTKRNWYVLYPDSSARRYDFQGICKKFIPGEADASAAGEPHEAQIAVHLSGAMTVTP